MLAVVRRMVYVSHQNAAATIDDDGVRANAIVGAMNAIWYEIPNVAPTMKWIHFQCQWQPLMLLQVRLSLLLLQPPPPPPTMPSAFEGADGGEGVVDGANDEYLKGLLKRLLLRADYFVRLHYY